MISNVVHFIYFTGLNSREFSFINYLAVRSAYEVQKPDTIYLYCNQEPVNNPHWEAIRPYANIVPTEAPLEYQGIALEYPQYQSDIVRLQKLIEHGGIYLDNDMITVQPYSDLLDNKCVMAIESTNDDGTTQSISNAVIMAEQGSEFLTTWLDAIPKNFKSDVWAYHAVVLPTQLYNNDPTKLTLLPKTTFTPFGWKDEYIFGNDTANLEHLKDARTIHMWETIWSNQLSKIDNNYLKNVDNLFTHFCRQYYQAPKLKIAVYTICKNEESFVDRWANSNSDADLRVVCDTGSSDSTVEKLRAHGVTVYNISVQPWRFDVARGTALNLLPADVDICIWQDLDEELLPGWRAELEKHWTDDATIANHRYRHNNGPWQWHSKIHARHGCIWTGAVHETLKWHRPEKAVWVNEFYLDEHQDTAKNRTSYLKLLERKIAEGDHNWRTYYFLSNDYQSAGMMDLAIETRIKSYKACADGAVVNSYIARNIARNYSNIGNTALAERWFNTSIDQSPERESLFSYAEYFYNTKDWDRCYIFAKRCINTTDRRDGFTYDEKAWGSAAYDYAAISAYNIGLYIQAVAYGEQAVAASPDDQRLKSNLNFYKEKV